MRSCATLMQRGREVRGARHTQIRDTLITYVIVEKRALQQQQKGGRRALEIEVNQFIVLILKNQLLVTYYCTINYLLLSFSTNYSCYYSIPLSFLLSKEKQQQMPTYKGKITSLLIKAKNTTLLANLSTKEVTIAATTILFIAYYY